MFTVDFVTHTYLQILGWQLGLCVCFSIVDSIWIFWGALRFDFFYPNCIMQLLPLSFISL